MSANPSTLILTNPRTALRGDIEVDRNFILVFEPPAGAVQTVGTDSSLKNITGLGSIVKRGDGALYINANIGTSTEAALDFRQGTLGGTGRIEHISYISDGDSSEPTVTFDPCSAPNKVGTLSISLADVPFQYDQFFRNVIFHVDIGDDGNGGTVNDKMDFSFSGGKGVSMKGMTVDIATVGGRYDDDGAGRAIITKIPLNTGITNPDIYTFKGVRFSGSATDPISNLRASRSFDPAPTNGSPPVPISILLHTSSVNASLLNWNNSNGATWEAGEIEWEDGLSHTAKAFKHGDQVMFMNGSPSVNRAVDVSTDGVIVGSMGIEGGSYTFTGGAIVGGIFHDYQGGWSDGKLTISGNATATINNRIDFEEIRIEFSNSKLILGNTGQLAYGQKIDLVEAGILEFAKNTDYTFTGIVKGSGTISQAGSGTLTLTGGLHSADYTEENNFVFDGKLLIAAGTTITFDLDANKTQKIIGVEGTVLLGEGTLNKIGAGTLTLEGAADFMGTINVKAGVLSLKDNAAGWSTNTLGNATLELEGNHTGSWQLNGMRSTISVAGANEVRFSGDITSLPDTQLVKAGTGNLILAGNNTYSGDTRVEEGTLTLRGTLGNMGTAPDTFNDYEKNIYISAGAQLRLENQTTSNSFSGESNYQRLSGNISGPGNMVINTTPQPGDTRNNTIYDFYGKVDAPMSVVRGTIGGTAFLSNVSFTSTISQPDPNLPPVASVVISPGNNWIQYEADGTTFTQETAPIGKLTIGQSNPTGYLNLTNVELLIDIDDGNKSDTLLISGNALWGAGNIVNIRTNPNSKESWDEATYIIARTNPANGQTTANYQKFMGTSQANLKTTEIRLNGLPVENTRLEASLTFMDELKSSKSMGEGASSGSLSSNGFGAIYQSDTSAIILKTKGGVSQVLYWQGKDAVTEAQSHKWTAAHKDGALNWKWNRTPDDSDRVISFWDGDAVFLSAKDGPLNKNPATALLDVTNRTVVIEALEPEHAGDPKTVYVASMFIDGGLSDNNPYRISGDKITGSMVSSTGSAIETTNSNEEFLWLTGKLTITPKGKATFENDVSFFEIIVQGKETLVDPYDVPIATPQTGGEVTFEGKTHILSEVLSIGQAATATLAGQGEFQNVGRITIGTGGKFIFNKNVDYAFDGSISNRPRLDTTAGDTYGSVLSYDTGGSVEKYGSGKVTLSGTNSYKGDTTVAAGTLAVTGVLGAYESIVDPGDYRYVPRYTNKITIGDAATLSFSPSHAVTEPAYDEEGNLIPQPAVPGMELPEQILAGDIVGPASGQGILRKEGEGILTLEKAVPATVRFEHTAGVLAGGYVGSALAIPDITFSQGAIISPGGRPTIYHESGTKHNTNATGGVGTGFSDALKYGRMTFGTGTNTTEFNGIQYNIDIDATNVANRDYIKVLGNARVGVDEFGTEVPNKVYLGAVSGFTDKTYVVMGVTGDLTTGDLTRTEFIYTNSGTDPRNRIALVRPLEGATTYGEDNLPWNKVLLLRSFLDANIGMTWTGVNFTDKTDNSTWSTSGTIKNWREGADANRYFKQADVVDFPDNVDIDVVVGETTSTVTFTVTQRDVQIVQPVIVGGMTVSGTGYTFSGDSISGTDNSADGSDPSKTTPNIFAPNKLSIIAGGEAEFRNSSVTFKEMEVVSGKALFLTPYTGTASGILNITGTAPIAVSGELVLGWGPNRSPFHTDSNKDITLSGNGSVDFRVAAGTPSTYSGLVNGTGGGGGSDPYAFVKSGPGSLIVSADQTYSGSTQVAEGSLTFQGTLGAVTSSGGTDRATYNGSMHVADAASLTLQVGTATRNVIQTLSSNVTAGAAGTGALIKTGPGRLNVNGTVAATFHAQAGIIGGTGTFQNGATISAGVLISAGLNNGTTGSVLTFEMATSTTVMLVPANAGMIVDIHNSSHSNSIFVAGTLTFDGAADSGTHPFTVNPVDVNEWRAGQYLVATATGGINLANGADKLYYDGRALDTYSDIGGRLVIKRNDVSGDTELWLLTYLASRGLVWWGTEVGHGTDTSDTWNSMTENWKYYENGSYPGPPPLSGPEEMTAFADGDHALFLNNQAPKTVVVQNGGVKVFAMTIGSVGNDAAFTFSGDGKITGRDDIWISDNVDPFAGASTPAGGLQIEAMGKAVFNNTGGLDFNGDILVEGEATFNYSVTTPKLRIEFDTGVDNPANAYARATLGNTGSFAGVAEINVEHVKSELVLNRTTNDGIYSGPIYGAGQLFKTGAAEMTLGGAITLTGPITVRGGKLSLTGTLGTKTGDTADAVTYTHNTGVITIEPTATLTINTPEKATNSNSELVEFIQVIDSIGKPDHPPTPTDRNYGTLRGASNTTLEIGGSSFNGTDPAITGRHSHVDIADSFSPFQGNIVVREGAKLDVTGRIGVFHDTWDKGTVWEATYWHANYAGKIELEANSKIAFSSTADYQQLSGILTGPASSTLEKGGYFPVYFTGDASGFSGSTNIVNGNFFIDTPAASYGAAGAGAFTVNGGAALYAELWRGNLTLNASNFTMATGSGLVVRGNGSLNIVTPVDPNTVSLAARVGVHIAVGALDYDASVRRLTEPEKVISPDPIPSLNPIPAAKVSFRSAAGTVRADADGVALPAGGINLSVAYNPTDVYVLITLLDGINIAALPPNVSVSTSSQDILDYLGLSSSANPTALV
jgi:autotransporter-associated beta strand protein